MSELRINENELTVLAFLAEAFGDDANCYGFAPIAAETGLDRKQVRRACRSLARKGLATYERALWNDEGRPAGAGYGATRAGRDCWRSISSMKCSRPSACAEGKSG